MVNSNSKRVGKLIVSTPQLSVRRIWRIFFLRLNIPIGEDDTKDTYSFQVSRLSEYTFVSTTFSRLTFWADFILIGTIISYHSCLTKAWTRVIRRISRRTIEVFIDQKGNYSTCLWLLLLGARGTSGSLCSLLRWQQEEVEANETRLRDTAGGDTQKGARGK